MIALFHPVSRAGTQRQAARLALAALLAGSVAGCGRDPFGPEVDFYHGLQGGEVAQQRPPPPGANEPYPNLATIPARPPAPDIVTEQRMADTLAAERDAEHRAAAADPLVVKPKPATAPPKPAAPDPNANHVVVDAAPAPTPAPAPAVPTIDQVPAVPADIASGPLPVFAASPPAPPTGLGVVQPVLAASKLLAPVPAPAKTPAPPSNTVAVAFTSGSATLPPSATLNLRRFALAHKGVPLTVTGQGEAASAAPDAQAQALQLALRRAQAIAASLAEAGVPAENLRLQAQAMGTGGSATL